MSPRAFRGAQSDRRPKPPATGPSLARLAGLAVVGAGVVLVADALARRLESAEPSTVVDGVRKRRGKSTPRSRPPSDGDGAETIDDDRLNADLTDGARSDDAIDERAVANVREEPASPGELTLDEELADELRADDREG
ncbi:hypothetical protein [Natronococcus jeotgali]|uniref:Uncharacterized protein n=1 Tax=Natronococcus jeotgali DSM 18795 TaxID=1227498 RepID=L9X3C9_9EURY|nr:hypothetical protein [Natronococcus jeotgali]ELY55073.1 hypothetical protein C492_16016 [Natronococcus jeotgali DSM 18795]